MDERKKKGMKGLKILLVFLGLFGLSGCLATKSLSVITENGEKVWFTMDVSEKDYSLRYQEDVLQIESDRGVELQGVLLSMEGFKEIVHRFEEEFELEEKMEPFVHRFYQDGNTSLFFFELVPDSLGMVMSGEQGLLETQEVFSRLKIGEE